MQARSQKQSLHPSLGGVKFVQQSQSRLSLPDNKGGKPKGGVDFLPNPGSECLASGVIKFP